MKISDITEQYLKSVDNVNCVWLSDSWLSMRGIETDKEKLALYDKIAEVKVAMMDKGCLFLADSYYVQ